MSVDDKSVKMPQKFYEALNTDNNKDTPTSLIKKYLYNKQTQTIDVTAFSEREHLLAFFMASIQSNEKNIIYAVIHDKNIDFFQQIMVELANVQDDGQVVKKDVLGLTNGNVIFIKPDTGRVFVSNGEMVRESDFDYLFQS